MGSPDAASRSDEAEATADRRRQLWFNVDGSDTPSSAGEVFESCRAYLLLVANRELDPRLRGRIAPSDVVQQTFLNAEEKFAAFRGTTPQELQAWLRRILLNNLTDARRRFCDAEKRAIAREQSLDGDSRREKPAFDVAAEALSPRASMIAREDVAVMREGLDRLPADYRTVVELRSLERLTFSEVGKRMQRSADAARKLWSRAIEHLQDELSTLDGDTSR